MTRGQKEADVQAPGPVQSSRPSLMFPFSIPYHLLYAQYSFSALLAICSLTVDSLNEGYVSAHSQPTNICSFHSSVSLEKLQ